jgi:hypothetical protein
MRLGTRPRQFIAGLIGLVLGTAPFWLNESSPLWPSKFSDEAQWVLEQVMLPGFLFSLLVGRGPHSFTVTIGFNVLFFGVLAYSYLVKPNQKP